MGIISSMITTVNIIYYRTISQLELAHKIPLKPLLDLGLLSVLLNRFAQSLMIDMRN